MYDHAKGIQISGPSSHFAQSTEKKDHVELDDEHAINKIQLLQQINYEEREG